MEKALAPLRERLRKVKPWAAVAILLAVLLVAYSALQAQTYLTASDDLDAATVRLGQLASVIDQLNQAVGGEVGPAKAERERERDSRKVILQEWKDQLFVPGFPTTTDPILGILFAVAQESNVGLTSMVVHEVDFLDPEEEATYQFYVQPITLIVQAKTHTDIYRFLSRLQLEMPSVRVENIFLTGFSGGEPAANLGLEFHLSPRPPPEEDKGG